MADAAVKQDPYQIAARIERLPFSRWHLRMGIVVGSGWFFDGFDAIAIAYVLPVLIPLWHLSTLQWTSLISIGYVGQLVGSIFFGWLAERVGRVPVVLYTLILYTAMSVVCAFAWDYQSLFWFRGIQGLGLGGEIPVLASYIGEFAKASHRGRYGLGFQLWFSISFIFVSGISFFVVPHYGWQAMFLIGALPALLILPLRRLMPESPRWLATRGRFAEADRILTAIEDQVSAHGAKPLEPIPTTGVAITPSHARVGDFLRGIYRQRTVAVWVVWFTTYIVIYGLGTAVPSLLRTIYGASLPTSIAYGFYTNGLGLVLNLLIIFFLIDSWGRKPIFTLGQLLSAIPLVLMGLYGSTFPLLAVIVCLMMANAFNAILALGLSTYTAELYPTEMRSLGVGIGNAWVRFASVVGPLFIGWAIPTIGMSSVYYVYAIAVLIGGLTMFFFAPETRNKVLEVLSPSLARH